MRTGEVEKLTEVKEANIKFYEREGLINPRRNENGYRDFSDEDIDKRFILKGVAFTAAFAVCVKFTVVLIMSGFSQQDTQQDTVFCFFWRNAGDFMRICVYFCGSLDQAGFLVCVGKELGRVRNGRTCQFVFDSRHRGWFGRNHVAALGRPADCVHCPFCNYPNGADACNKRNRASEMKARQMNMMRRRRPGRLFFFS